MKTADFLRGLWIAASKPSLEQITRKIVRRHFAKNASLQKHRYGSLRRSVSWIKSHAYTTIVLALLGYLVIAVSAFLIYPLQYGPRTPVNVSDFYRDLQTINLAVLAAQATFIGLVFPIVIALVGLLSEGKISYRGRLNLFLEETEASYVGVSALVLIAVLLLQLLALNQMPERVGAALTALNLLWFGSNTFAIGFFLFQTLRYIQPDLRFQIEKRYISNVIWRDQLTELIRNNRWGNAQHYGYWPNAEELVGDKEEAPLIVTYRFHDQSDYDLEIDAGKSRRVEDIKIYLVGNVLRSWLGRYSDQEDRSRFSWLEFCLSPKQTFEGPTRLLQIKSGPKLSKREEFLLKEAFKVGQEKPLRDKGTVVQFIDEMISDLIRLAEEGRSSEFSRLLSQLTELHAFLFAIAEAPREDERFNYAQMSDRMGRDLSQRWASSYRELHKKVVSQIGTSPDLFESTAWWSPKIIGLAKSSAFDAATGSAMLLSSHLLRRLLDWAANEHSSVTGYTTNAATSFEVPTQLISSYGSAWRTYVGSWERILDVLAPEIAQSSAASVVWEELQRAQKAYEDHLQRSVEHVALSAASGDQMAVRWTTDILIKWPSGLLFANEDRNVLNSIQPIPLTVDILNLDWLEVPSQVQSEMPRNDEMGAWTPDPKEIWKSALDNLWLDASIVLSTVLVRWSLHYGVQGQASEAARRVLQQDAHDEGWRGIREGARFSFSAIMTATLRMAGAQNGRDEGSHSAQLSSLAGRLLDIGSPQYVSMRIYSGTGDSDFLTLTTEQVIVLASKVPVSERSVRLSYEVRTLFDAARSDDQRRRMIAHLEKLQRALLELDRDAAGPLLHVLRQDELAVEAVLAALGAQLQAHIAAFQNIRDEQFEDADIDPQRLREISEAASSLGFATETGEFPISVFEEIALTDEQLTDFTLTSGEQNSGEYTDPLFSDPVSNEREFWAEVIKQRSAVIVMRDILQNIEALEVTAPTAQAFWEAVQKGAVAISDEGLTPILIVPSQSEPSWLIDWRWSRDETAWRPENLRIAKSDGQPNGYLYHLNDLPVFVAPIPRSSAYLVPIEIFQKVEFSRFEGLPVKAEFQQDADDQWKGTLRLTFSRSVALGPETAFQIIFGETE